MSFLLRGFLLLILAVIVVLLCFSRWNGGHIYPSPVGAGFISDTEHADAFARKTSDAPRFSQDWIFAPHQVRMVHVVSLLEEGDGTLAAVWYGGSEECAPDVDLYFSTRSGPNGSWSPARVIFTRQEVEKNLGYPVKSLGNAVLLEQPDKSLRLLFVTVIAGRWSGSQLNTSVSRDGGQTWSPAQHLYLSPLFNFSELVRNRPISLVGGGWCIPIYQEFIFKFPELLWFQDQGGKISLCKTRLAGGGGTLQPSLVPWDSKHALALLRSFKDMRRIFLSQTVDAGVSWSPPASLDLPNPDSAISGLYLADGKLLLAFNDSEHDRNTLTLAISPDQGKTWKRLAVLESDPRTKISFAYPYLMRTSDGLFHLAYTWKAKGIRMVTFNEEWIRSREASP